jgi:hypothetical protein
MIFKENEMSARKSFMFYFWSDEKLKNYLSQMALGEKITNTKRMY